MVEHNVEPLSYGGAFLHEARRRLVLSSNATPAQEVLSRVTQSTAGLPVSNNLFQRGDNVSLHHHSLQQAFWVRSCRTLSASRLLDVSSLQ
jgi:hypothetical protein